MKLTNEVEIRDLPDGVLLDQRKFDFESIAELTLYALTAQPLRTDDPREELIRRVREAIVVKDEHNRRFIRLDLLSRSNEHEGESAESKVGQAR